MDGLGPGLRSIHHRNLVGLTAFICPLVPLPPASTFGVIRKKGCVTMSTSTATLTVFDAYNQYLDELSWLTTHAQRCPLGLSDPDQVSVMNASKSRAKAIHKPPGPSER